MGDVVWTFPGGVPLVDVIPATAGDAVDTYTVPAGKRNQILSIKITLTADATVANRFITASITDGTNTIWENQAGAITASATSIKYFIIGLTTSGAKFNALLHNNLLPPGYELKISIENGVAGDSFEGFTSYREIDEP